jgi:DedD protein
MSREEGLYKDKIEVSLDGRQIFYLFFGGAVIVGLVFVLGVMVGRRVEARGHVERAQTQAAVDPLAALDRLEGGGGLSFQGALRGSGDAPASDVEKTIGEMARAKEPAIKKPAAAVPVAEVKKLEEPKAEKKADEPKPEKKADEPKPEKKTDEAKQEKKSQPEDRKPTEGDKRSSDKEFLAKLEAKTEKRSDSDKPIEKKAKYTLQLSSFQDKGEADAYLATMKSNGFSPYLTEADVDGKKYYRIRLGNYRSVDAANDAKAGVEKATKKSASVMKL